MPNSNRPSVNDASPTRASALGDGAASATSPPPRYPFYDHIPYPALDHLRHAAYLWDQIAEHAQIKYAFVGRVGAVFRGNNCQICGIEILVEPSTMANNAARLTEIANNQPRFFAITQSNHHIIVIECNRGVALQFHTTGSNGYPDIIPPYDSPLRTAHRVGVRPTYRLQNLGYRDNRQVPVMLFRVLLEQRLSRFDPYTTSRDHEAQNQRDVNDIVLYLSCTTSDGEESFTPGDVIKFLPIVRRWIPYAECFSILTSTEAVDKWRRLGLPLTEADISERLRMGPSNPMPMPVVLPAQVAGPFFQSGCPTWQFSTSGQAGYIILLQQPAFLSYM
jgi:hypothetical protein